MTARPSLARRCAAEALAAFALGALASQLVRGRPLPDPSALPVRAPERP